MNNKILIIGASSDTGIELIKSLDPDYTILAHYNSSPERLLELKETFGSSLVMLKADLSSEEETTEMINKVSGGYGTPGKIVHLAASKFENIRFKDIRWDYIQNEINVSLRSLTLVLTHFLPLMAKEKSGKVVCMLSSVVINTPPKALAHYTAVKYSMLGLIRAAAVEYADKNIQINAVSPSMIETRFLKDINEKLIEINAFNHPLKRNAYVSDIIPCIKMLLSDSSDYISGVNIPVTGGSVI